MWIMTTSFSKRAISLYTLSCLNTSMYRIWLLKLHETSRIRSQNNTRLRGLHKTSNPTWPPYPITADHSTEPKQRGAIITFKLKRFKPTDFINAAFNEDFEMYSCTKLHVVTLYEIVNKLLCYCDYFTDSIWSKYEHNGVEWYTISPSYTFIKYTI